jgi:hypothetical protein
MQVTLIHLYSDYYYHLTPFFVNYRDELQHVVILFDIAAGILLDFARTEKKYVLKNGIRANSQFTPPRRIEIRNCSELYAKSSDR